MTSKWQQIKLFGTLGGTFFSFDYVLGICLHFYTTVNIIIFMHFIYFFSQPENEEKNLVYDNIGPNVCMGDHKVTSQAYPTSGLCWVVLPVCGYGWLSVCVWICMCEIEYIISSCSIVSIEN